MCWPHVEALYYVDKWFKFIGIVMFKNFFGWGESAKGTSEVRVNNPSQSVSADARGGIPQSAAAAGSK